MIDRKFIGFELEPHSALVERGRLKFFAKATGQKDPIYLDESAAREAGFADLPAPPTFLFSLDLERENPYEIFDILGVDLMRILHGEQKFKYIKPICAGDTITLKSKITDIYDKKNGAMEFIVQITSATNQNGEMVGEMSRIIVVRN